MEEIKQDATQESSSALAQAIASSPEVNEEAQEQTQHVQDTETATPQQAESQEPTEEKIGFDDPRHPEHPRFKQLKDENRFLRDNMQQLINQRQQQLIFQQPQQDPYQGMTAEEKVFWQGIDKRIEERATQIADTKIRQIAPSIEAGRMELAKIGVQQFRVQHPDVKPDSPEEISIAGKISQGYNSDDAYWAVMGPRGIRNAEVKGQEQFKQRIAAKRQANVETSASIPVGATPAPKKSFREEMAERLD